MLTRVAAAVFGILLFGRLSGFAQIVIQAPGIVSVRELLHPPSKDASRIFASAMRHSAAGDHAKAADEFRSTVARAPEFAEAWNNLGVEYLQMDECGAGIPALEQAARLMPEAAPVQANLSYAYGVEHRFIEAETAARTALRLDRHLLQAHYLLGRYQMQRQIDPEEAVEHLKLARDQVPASRFTLAVYYIRTGQFRDAERELRTYAAIAKDEERVEAERMLASLAGLTVRPVR